jgi:2-hydroxychromene-2-carboxylate isomerase
LRSEGNVGKDTCVTKTIAFHFDYLSPYAYLAWLKIHALAEQHGRTVTPVPTLLAALLSAHGHKGPAEIEPKRIYTGKHVLRLAADHGVPLAPPPVHPFNPLLALRVSSLAMPEAERRRVIDAIYSAVWGRGEGVHDEEHLRRALRGFDADALIAAAKGDDAKVRLRTQTDAALALGCFGVPTMFVDGELFWGFDALPHVDRFLAGKDPLDAAQLEVWKKAVVFGVRRS